MEIFVEKALDKVTDELLYADRLPSVRAGLEAVTELQSFYEDHATITNHGRIRGGAGDWKHIASLQQPIDLAIRFVESELLKDRKAFYRWLRKHPRSQAYHMGS